jgi:hypothetical protein
MKTKSISPLGSLHPILFMATMYIVTLLFSIFICSSLFYSCNTTSAKPAATKTISADIKKDEVVKR